MGFMDSLGGIVKNSYGKLQDRAAKIEELKGRYEHYSDEKLIRMLKGRGSLILTDSGETAAMGNVLRDRGYSDEDFSKIFRGKYFE